MFIEPALMCMFIDPFRLQLMQPIVIEFSQQAEGLTRSYSMSGAYANTMSLDRGHVVTYPGSAATETGDLRSQSMMDIAGNRHTLADMPSSQPPPPYQLRPSSHDDINLFSTMSTIIPQPHPRRPVSSASYNLDPVLRRERARYESIRERTEPESSSTSSEEDGPRRRPRPPPRLRVRPRPRSEEMMLDSKDLSSLTPLESSQSVRSREGTPVSAEAADKDPSERPRPELITNGSLRVEGGRGPGGQQRHKSASSGDLNLGGDVRFRKRTKRERLRMYRQGTRRFTMEGLDIRGGGLYDDTVSETYSDTCKKDKAGGDLFTAYNNLTKEELLRVVIQNKAQLIRKDQYIRDLESYIDNLLVRVMETQPRILHRPPLHPR
ncbi:hypothetical protein ACOMHN_065232 [Nucella lapillus]